MTRGMRLPQAKAHVADKLGVSPPDLSDPVIMNEVREKLGLVYRVSATHGAARGRAGVFVYAGTTPQNAKQTILEVASRLEGASKAY